MNSWHGSQTFSAPFLNTEVDYAVYAPGQFANSSALGYPTDPSGGTQYVYAYQVLNNTGGSEAISTLSVGLYGLGGPNQGKDKQVANIEQISYAGDVSPGAQNFSGTPAQSALWNFSSPSLSIGKVSSILLYTSPFPPETDNSSVQGATGDTERLPSPVPEPVSWLLIVVVAALLLTFSVRRTGIRVYNP
jgi:hypothetical protein